MSQSVGFALLVLAGITCSVSACSCVPRTDEQKYCQDNFAIVFKTKDNVTVEGDIRVYQVDFLAIYRTVPVKNLDTSKIYTAVESATCGVTFIADSYYAITGYYNVTSGQPTRIQANLCSLNMYFPFDPRRIIEPPECETPDPEKEYA
ncbi:uncharacterized protein LOC123536933 [Mercenaria mercenaria]|uniref:uncharacterized protein LOC123536933 n=1 Tax=Mercenaria mercenaria TaxID=6596 RepID=UPI00234EA261|nr:uncharacterized protein LOC123536933 [Mercenaria mercenaria]